MKIILLMIAILFFAGCVSNSNQPPVECTLDAKICPNGSAVGRVPPACEFAPCPPADEIEEAGAQEEIQQTSEQSVLELPSLEPVFDPDAKPVLQNLGVNFGSWNKQTNRAGDFLFQKGLFDDKLFFEFGTYLVGNNGPKLIPELTYYLPDKTKIFSPVNGKISQITKLYSDDYAVHIQTSPDSQWLVTFEHVENLIVQEGQTVEVGTILGEASTFGGGEGVAFTELVVWKGGATLNDIIKLCPVPLLDPLVRVEYEEKFVQLTKDWEAYIGKNIYDEEEWVAPGCIREQMTEYEAMNPGA